MLLTGKKMIYVNSMKTNFQWLYKKQYFLKVLIILIEF